MPQLQTLLFLHVFTALLPPPDDRDEKSYYELLQLEPSCSQQDIRKAYRVLSLQLHPDKIAQKGGSHVNVKEAAAQYEQVQIAYAVLMDPSKRKSYDSLGRNKGRYQFLCSEHQNWQTRPMQMYENLTAASFLNKSRLVVLAAVFFLALLVQPILVAAKINAILHSADTVLHDSPWVVVLIPTWVLHGMFILFWLFLLCVVSTDIVVAIKVLEHCAWLAGEVVLALQWDRALQLSWHVVSIPFYLGVFLRLFGHVASVHAARTEQGKMISPDYVHVLKRELYEKSSQDQAPLADEQIMAIIDSDYIIVSVDAQSVSVAKAMMNLPDQDGQVHPASDEEIELLKVTTSFEFMQLQEVIQSASKASAVLILIGITFVALVASKLQGNIDANWWTVFVPWWLYFGFEILLSFLLCCCIAVPGDYYGAPDNDDNGSVVEGIIRSEAFEPTEGGISRPLASQPTVEQTLNPKAVENDGIRVTAGNPNDSILDVPFDEKSISENVETRQPTGVEVTVSKDFLEEERSEELQDNSTDVENKIEANSESNNDTPADTARGDHATQSTNANELSTSSAANAMIVDEDDNDSQSAPDIDLEETFYAWQQAQAHAERSAMEQQSKAQATCCGVCFQLIILCLIVGKLQQSYDYSDAEKTDPGFNAFWVLFPIFLLLGMILCCCSCLIYCAGSSTLDTFAERAQGEGRSRNDDAQGETKTTSGANDETGPVIVVAHPADLLVGNNSDEVLLEAAEDATPDAVETGRAGEQKAIEDID
jgi:hypothetical protein